MNKTRRNKHRRGNSRRNRIMYGGMAPVGDSSMMLGQKDNLSQGQQFLSMHRTQHGGMSPYPAGVTDSVLSGPMIASARTGPLDGAIAQIQGMQDGGKRRKGKKHSRKHKGGRRSRKHRGKKHRGGAHSGAVGAPLSENPMLLPAGMDKQAALHNEWQDAKNPNAFVPKA